LKVLDDNDFAKEGRVNDAVLEIWKPGKALCVWKRVFYSSENNKHLSEFNEYFVGL
jgi:hypothetical protein